MNQFITDVGLRVDRTYAGSTVGNANVKQLLSILTPLEHYYPIFQRDIDFKRIERLSNEQIDDYKKYNGYGIVLCPIVFGYCEQGNHRNKYHMCVVDGNHRLNVLKELLHFSPVQLDGVDIPIRIFRAHTMEELRSYYVTINQNYVPHTPYDLDDTKKAICDGVTQWLRQQYDKCFFSPSEQPKRPNLSLKNLRMELSMSQPLRDIIEDHAGDVEHCVAHVCRQIDVFNRFLHNQDYVYFMKKQSTRERTACVNAHNKCRESEKPLYLGLLTDCVNKALEYCAEPPRETLISLL